MGYIKHSHNHSEICALSGSKPIRVVGFRPTAPFAIPDRCQADAFGVFENGAFTNRDFPTAFSCTTTQAHLFARVMAL